MQYRNPSTNSYVRNVIDQVYVVWYGGTTLKDISSDPTESWTKGHKVVWVVGKP